MTFRVEVTESAKRDLQEIYDYIAYSLKSPINADSLMNKLESEITSLETMPARYKRYETEPWHSRGMRLMSVGNFIVFYIPDEEKQIVFIKRVMYGGRDIDSEMTK